jgi:hypothetical protein
MFKKLEKAASGNLHDPVALHALRIRCKDVRYALEVFRPCVEEGFDELYAEVEDLQEELGHINDAAELLDRIERFRDARSDAMELPDAGWNEQVEAALQLYSQKRDRLVEGFLVQWSQGRWRRVMDATPAGEPKRCSASASGQACECMGREEIVVTAAAPRASKGCASMRAAG